MYAWIWRKLPFGVPGKVAGSLILVLGIAALLWFVAFPRLSSLMTPTQSTVNNEDGGGGGEQEQPNNDSDRVSDNPDDYKTETSPEGDESQG